MMFYLSEIFLKPSLSRTGNIVVVIIKIVNFCLIEFRLMALAYNK